MKNYSRSSLFCLADQRSDALVRLTTFAKADLNQAEIDKIVTKFTQNEATCSGSALNVYAFNRNATIQTVGMGGQITGTYKRESFMTFDGGGKRVEKILLFPSRR